IDHRTLITLTPGSIRLDARSADDAGPFGKLALDQRRNLVRCRRGRFKAERNEPRLHVRQCTARAISSCSSATRFLGTPAGTRTSIEESLQSPPRPWSGCPAARARVSCRRRRARAACHPSLAEWSRPAIRKKWAYDLRRPLRWLVLRYCKARA